MPSAAAASVRAMTTKPASVRASTAAFTRSTISSFGTTSLPGRWPQRFCPTWSSRCTAATPTRSNERMVRAMLKAPPQPVSMSTSNGSPVASTMRRASISTSSMVLMPRSGMPSELAATPPPERYSARKPTRRAIRPAYAVIAPTTCKGCSSRTAARNRVPADAVSLMDAPPARMPQSAARRLDFAHEIVGAVDVAQRLEHRAAVHRYRAVQALVVPVVAAERMDVAVEHQTDDFGLAVDHRTAGVAADDVVGGDEVVALVEVDAILCIVPALRQGERVVAGFMPEGAPHRRERRYRHALLVPALDLAEREALREGRVGIDAGAVLLEACRGNQLRVACNDRFDVGLVTLADRAAVGIDAAREHDERIVRLRDGLASAFPERLAHGRIAELRALD